nr:DUF2076 domain-containing protein [Aeromonas veronii]
MQSQEQGLIDGLFDRLKQAQARDSKRDPQADQLIRQHLAQQPDAPYYMAQALLIQQAALTRLNERVKELEASQSTPSGGSFLSGLFGSESSPPPRFTPPPATAPAQPASRASSFLGGRPANRRRCSRWRDAGRYDRRAVSQQPPRGDHRYH